MTHTFEVFHNLPVSVGDIFQLWVVTPWISPYSSMADVVQDPQWMAETMASMQPYIDYVSSCRSEPVVV